MRKLLLVSLAFNPGELETVSYGRRQRAHGSAQVLGWPNLSWAGASLSVDAAAEGRR